MLMLAFFVALSYLAFDMLDCDRKDEGKALDQIRQTFNVESDLIHGEEEKQRKMTPWFYDKEASCVELSTFL